MNSASGKENLAPPVTTATPVTSKAQSIAKSTSAEPKAKRGGPEKTSKTPDKPAASTQPRRPPSSKNASLKTNGVKVEEDDIAPPSSTINKRKRPTKVKEGSNEPEEALHGMVNGSDVKADPSASEAEENITSKRPKTTKKPAAKKVKVESSEKSAAKAAKDSKDAERAVAQLALVKSRYEKEEAKRREAATTSTNTPKSKRETYGLSEGVSPFPDYPHPTPSECHTVHSLLSKKHPECKPQPSTVPEPSKFVAGCGEVRSILDALIRTRLSASTTGRNSSAAYQGMVARYGLLKKGVGKGGVDYNAVRRAPVEDLFRAIKGGGLAVSKSADIKALVDIVFEENQARRRELLDARDGKVSSKGEVEGKAKGRAKAKTKGKGPKGAEVQNEEQKDAEIKLAEEENLSLDHFYTLPTYDAIYKFMTFPGIGVKTAACVAMFCMQRPCFAVDTHVFRIAKWLGWVPPSPAETGEKRKKGEKAVDRDTTFSHLEVRVPDELKYMLHQLFIKHGKTCPRCRGNTGEGSSGWSKGCVIDHLVQRTGPRKGNGNGNGNGSGESPAKGRSRGGGRRKGVESDEDVDMPDLNDDEEESDEMPELNDEEEPSDEESE